ncbi:MAG: hypothetical protein NUV86_10020, partial [Candidatus Scalindua sp.]|nr:hypothetical protein [Candidatus Scalindua sp.]
MPTNLFSLIDGIVFVKINPIKRNARIYKYEYSREQHIKLLEVIKSLPCMVMISGYESTVYKESLRNWQTHCFQAVCHHGVANAHYGKETREALQWCEATLTRIHYGYHEDVL